MAVSEQRRHQLYNRLEEVLGQDEAAALIEYFPPTGWNDVVRTRDLDAAVATLRAETAALRAEMHELIGHVRVEIGGLRAEIRTQTRSLFLSLVGLQITGAGMAIAVARLI